MDEKLAGLLMEWMQWWWTTDIAPAKMPDALHIRTLLALAEHDSEFLARVASLTKECV